MADILKIIVLLLGWWLGAKAKREQRAKEIADLFAKTTKEGDRLGEQIWTNLNKRSETDWDDIELREP